MTRTAIILAGHGSHISPDTAGLVWSHVDSLRRIRAADEITAAFWKEVPSFHSVFNTISADDITVVPLFTAQGYFTQTVIPTEMGLTGAVTVRDGKTIRYTRTLNEHPYLSQVVQRRVEEAAQTVNISAEETAVAIIGHSTRRNPESRKATEAQAEHIRALGIAAQVEAVYLDDSPEIHEIYAMTSKPYLVAVPYFLASGSHTTIDVPRELGLEPGQKSGFVDGRWVFYTLPVGVEDDLRKAILELISDAGTPLPIPANGSSWDCLPSVGRELLIGTVGEVGVMRFGQLRLSMTEVCHWEDNEGEGEVINTPERLRARVRENPFRPLATSDDLPGGWCVPIQNANMLHAVVETIYPGGVADWAADRQGNFRSESLELTVFRQTGMYQNLASLSLDQQSATVESICGCCVRWPAWFEAGMPKDSIPCREACNFWMSRALEKNA